MKFFMAAAPHSVAFHTDLEGYLDASAAYIVAKEVSKTSHKETNGEHFHVAADMSDKQYDSFRNTILKKKYNLRGKATKDKPRQYGIVKDVRDETKFLHYTVKSQNIIYRNIDLKTIQDYISKSYIKEEKKDFQQMLLEHLLFYPPDYFLQELRTQNLKLGDNPEVEWNEIISVDKIQVEIVEFNMLKGSKPLCRSRLQFYTNLFLQHHWSLRYQFIYQIVQIINSGRVS